MHSPPPTTDERALADCLLRFADRCDAISDRLLAMGLTLPSKVWREEEEACARSAEELDELRLVRRESRRERLAALRGPMDLNGGFFPPWAGYRSAFLDGARAAAAARIAAAGPGDVACRPLSACERRSFAAALGGPLPVPVGVAADQVRAEAARALMPPDAAGPADVTLERLWEVYAGVLDRPGIARVPQNRKRMAYSTPIGDGRWRLFFVDDSAAGLEYGRLEPAFVITDGAARLGRNTLGAGKLAGFVPGNLIPWFDVSSKFAWGDFAEFHLAAVTVATLARLVFEDLRSH